MMWMMWWWMVVFWIALIGAAVWLIADARRSKASDAIDVLRRRLAAGEIDLDEFRRREDELARSRRRRPFAAGWLALAIVTLMAIFVVVPASVMVASGWDTWDWDMGMWNMHGRGRSTSDSALVQAGSQANVTIEDFAFSPGNLEVPVGAIVTWTNEDSAAHDATARKADWQTERLSKGESETLTFDTAGEYDYYCSIHPSMKARLTVR